MTAKTTTLGTAVRTAVAAAALLAAACAKEAPPPAEDDGWTPDPVAEAKDVTFTVAAEPKVVLGEDLVFRVTVRNGSTAKARLNVPRLSRDSVSFRVRSTAFDLAWLDPVRIQETDRGARFAPAEVREVPPGGTVEGEIRQTAALCGKLTFLPVYSCQSLGVPIAGDPITVEVAPAPGGASLGVRMETSHGVLEARLRPDLAFQTATSFATLVKSGFFDGLSFHRVVKGFMAQGGDPTGKGWGGPGYVIRRELNTRLLHRRGVLSMARQEQPDTAGSQFFLMFRTDPNLDRLGYATFGEMTSGEETLARIEAAGSASPASEAPVEPITLRKATLFVLP